MSYYWKQLEANQNAKMRNRGNRKCCLPPPKDPREQEEDNCNHHTNEFCRRGGRGAGGNAEKRYQHVPVLKTFIFKIILIAKGGRRCSKG